MPDASPVRRPRAPGADRPRRGAAARRGRVRRRPRPHASASARAAWRRTARPDSIATKPAPTTSTKRATTSSSPPARTAARPSATTCPRSRPASPSPPPAPSTSSRPRPSPKTSSAGSSRSCPRSASRPRLTTATRPCGQRAAVRKLSHILLTNPDMLHLGILPGHEHWGKFLRSLRLIVLDEMHVYRGVFGSNVGNVLRRLLRLCEWHRAKPQIVACSATIGNPREVFRELTGREAILVDEDGSPHGKRTFVFWNPPEVGEGRRLSANVATSEILATLAEAGQRTLAFSRARVSAELVLRYARRRVAEGSVKPDAIESYRAGYTPKERRVIEQGLFKGKLLGLSATSAMELGVDVGGLDAVVINGYPGTGSSFWQQAGRAGSGDARRPRRVRGPRGPARPVPRSPTLPAPGGPQRARRPQPAEPADPDRPPALRRPRAAPRAERAAPVRRGRRRRRRGDGPLGRAGVPGRPLLLPFGRPARAQGLDPGRRRGGRAADGRVPTRSAAWSGGGR